MSVAEEFSELQLSLTVEEAACALRLGTSSSVASVPALTVVPDLARNTLAGAVVSVFCDHDLALRLLALDVPLLGLFCVHRSSVSIPPRSLDDLPFDVYALSFGLAPFSALGAPTPPDLALLPLYHFLNRQVPKGRGDS